MLAAVGKSFAGQQFNRLQSTVHSPLAAAVTTSRHLGLGRGNYIKWSRSWQTPSDLPCLQMSIIFEVSEVKQYMPVVTIAVWRMVVTRTGVTRDHRITIQLHWIHYTGYILRDVSIPCPLTMSVTNWHWTVCILCHTSTIILGADTETGWCLLMVLAVDSLLVCTYHSIRWRVNNQERNFLNYIL